MYMALYVYAYMAGAGLSLSLLFLATAPAVSDRRQKKIPRKLESLRGISLTLRRVYVYPVAVPAYECQAVTTGRGYCCKRVYLRRACLG